jgi:hypothetical protein
LSEAGAAEVGVGVSKNQGRRSAFYGRRLLHPPPLGSPPDEHFGRGQELLIRRQQGCKRMGGFLSLPASQGSE